MNFDRSRLFVALSLALGGAALGGLAGCGGAADMSQSKGSMSPAAPDNMAAEEAPPGMPADAAPSTASADKAGSAQGAEGNRVRETFKPEAQQPSSRPGLGTTWGETRSSHITSSAFSRADSTTPFSMASLFYNDAQGAKAMANATGFREFSTGSVDIGNGVATMSLKDADNGRFLNGFEAGGKSYVVGAAGQHYKIVVQSNVPARLEIVVSVDGLDVLDGKAASFSKRGYLIDPNGSVEIDGFRQSMDAVAAFTFGSVRDSYAQQKHGDARNVGVIGIALFNEQGTNPASWTRGEVQRRLDANPFPGQFATPPH